MTKTRMMVLLTVFSITAGVLTAAPAADVAADDETIVKDPAVEEGFFFDGVEGTIMRDGDIWMFAPDENVFIADGRNFSAGKALVMLPCSVLEQMSQVAGTETKLAVRLWALFTEYVQVNYLFSVYFLPLEQTAAQLQPTVSKTQTNSTDEKPVAPPNRDSIIPENILSQIKSYKTPDLKKFQQISQVTGDTNLIGRSGYLYFKDDNRIFQPDAFGMKINSTEFILLPNHMRGDAEMQTMAEPGRERYNVSGLVTEYKGKTYMLLRRASRTYTNGNFTN